MAQLTKTASYLKNIFVLISQYCWFFLVVGAPIQLLIILSKNMLYVLKIKTTN